ncbi:MAG: YceI family protein [Vulcanimicrobiaceae bacterium]
MHKPSVALVTLAAVLSLVGARGAVAAQPLGADDCDVTGELTIKGVTKSVSFPVHVEGRAMRSV